MALTHLRQAGHTVYKHVKRGLRGVDAIVHKAALVYSLTHPLLHIRLIHVRWTRVS